MKYRKILITTMFMLIQFIHAQTDSSYQNKTSNKDFLMGTLKITSQTVGGLGVGILAFNSFQKPHTKISPVAVGSWFICSSFGVSLVGKYFYGDYNYISSLTGGILGAIVSLPMLSTQTNSGYYIVAGSIVGEIIGYHLSLNTSGTKNLSGIQFFPKSSDYSSFGEYSIHIVQVRF